MSNISVSNEKEIEETNFEKQKIVYEKASELHRYYLSWRQFLFAGFIAVIGLIIFKCCDTKNPLIIAILLFIASIISIVFYLLDNRNSDLYHICQKVESNIEDNWFKEIDDKTVIPISSFKLYKNLDQSHKTKKNRKGTDKSKEITHTIVLHVLYLGCAIASYALSIVFLSM